MIEKKAKYRLSPFNVAALALFVFGLYLLLDVLNTDYPGLGAAAPGIILFAALGVLVIDFIMQRIFRKRLIWLYVIQAGLITWALSTFFQSKGIQTFIVTEKKPQFIRIIYGVPGQPELPFSRFRAGYEIELPVSGTILTSTEIDSDLGFYDFRWEDGDDKEFWQINEIYISGEYWCPEGSPRAIRYRLLYLSTKDIRSWRSDPNWVESFDTDRQTSEEIANQCNQQ